MNYQKHYGTLMTRAKTRLIEGYTEKHHIIPKCIGGSNDTENIVSLTPEEHYVAHQLLIKIYPNESKLVYAAHMMGNTRKNNKSYGWLRKRHSKLLTGVPRSEEIRQKLSERMKGRQQTEDHKRKTSAIRKGKTYKEIYGSEEAIRLLEIRRNQIPWNKGISASEEHRRRNSESQKRSLAKKRGLRKETDKS